ncbi:AAA family ATPase [Candidatus Dependentiae bacterium]|nr:MAG: AAA family ATPase [Candidatus Dependentiae bacterium]
MKIFSNCTKLMRILSCLVLFNIPHTLFFTTSADQLIPTDPTTSLITEAQKDNLEQLLLKTLNQLKQIEVTIEDLATVVSNDIVTKIKDKSDHLIKLRLTREIINLFTNNSYTVVDEHTIYALIHFTRSITYYLLDAIENGFYELDCFDEKYIQIPQVNSIGLEDLEKELQNNEKILSKLDYKAANIGLCWYNKLYRCTKRNIASPWRKYHLGPIMLIGSVATTAGLLLWWQFDINFPQWLRDFTMPGTNKRIFGPTPRFDAAGEVNKFYDKNDFTDRTIYNSKGISIENPDFKECFKKIGLLGAAERIVAGLFFSNQAPVTSKIATLALGAIGANVFSHRVTNWISEKCQNCDNFLMGGVYRHRGVGNIQYKSKINFDDVIGCEKAKDYGKQLCMYLKDPERFDRANLTPAKGYLLVGETRTGKSYFVEALLGELQRTFGTSAESFKIFKVPYALIEKEGIETLLAVAKDFAPCILFIDEIDLLGLERTAERKRLSEFLTAMSGYLSEIDPGKAVIIIGATNKQESIDRALKQPGRFGKIILFERPNYNERKEYIKCELDKKAINPDLFDIERLARETEGYVFEAIGLSLQQAMIKAKINNQPINQELLENSFDDIIRGILEDTKVIPEDQKEMLAVHQAGHALVTILLDPRLKLSKVTIQKIKADVKEKASWVQELQREEDKQKPIEYGALFCNHEQDALEFENKEEQLKQCKIMLAGHIAEQLLLGSCSYSYHKEDRQRALKLTQAIVFRGLTPEQLPKNIKDQYISESYNLLLQCEQEVEALLREHQDNLSKLAQSLKERGMLSIRDIQMLLNGQSQEPTKNKKDANNELLNVLEKNKPEPHAEG